MRSVRLLVACAASVAVATACGKDEGSPSGPGAGGHGAEGGTSSNVGGSEGGSGGAPVDTGVDLGGGVTVVPGELVPGESATIFYRGALADQDEVTIRYGFNGWSPVRAGRSQEDDGTGNLDFYLESAMTPLPAGDGFSAVVDVPLEARALHAVFRAGGDWDNHEGADYNHGVVFPYIGPYLSWDEQTAPEDGFVVSFVTGHLCEGWVEYGDTPSLTTMASESSAARYHHVRLEGLTPGSLVYYRVGCGEMGSETYSARTASSGAQAFELIVLGDMQDDGDNGRWADTAQAIVQDHAEAELLVITGDMAWNDRPGLWWTFFDRGRELFASKVMMPVAGNHDTPGVDSSPDTTSFETFFATPLTSGAPTYYAFEYASARFFALNSEIPGDFAPGGVQLDWLTGELTQDQPEWVFAYWHIPPYDAGAGHWSQQSSFRDITALFDGALDWFFGGHEHLYQRHKPLRYNATLAPSGLYGRGPDDGVGYLIVPPAGVWPRTALIAHDHEKAYYRDRLAYPVVAPPADTAPSEIGFVHVAIDGKTISLTTWGLGTIEQPAAAHVVDAVSYTKP